jgi:hypothetical protein
LIYTNRVQDLMLLLFVNDTSHVKQVGNEMKELFTSGDGARCKVMSIHFRFKRSKYVYFLSVTFQEECVMKNSARLCVCCWHACGYCLFSFVFGDS